MKQLLYLSAIVLELLVQPIQTTAQRKFQWVKTVGSTEKNTVSSALLDGEFTKYLCVDDNKNIYAATSVVDDSLRADTFISISERTQFSVMLTSYTCDGTMRWARKLECASHTNSYGLQYRAGNLYIAGRFADTPGNINRHIGRQQITGHDSQSYFLASFDTLGSVRWVKFIGGNDRNSTINVHRPPDTGKRDHGLALDRAGSPHFFVYLPGGMTVKTGMTSVAGTYDLKYDISGNLVSAIRLGVDSTYTLYARGARTTMYKNSIAISPVSGKIFMVLNRINISTSGSVRYNSPRLCGFSPSGSLLWEDSIRYDPNGLHGELRDVCYDGENGLYLCGFGAYGKYDFLGLSPTPALKAGPGVPLAMIIKVDTNGKPVWMYANEHLGSYGGHLANTMVLPDGDILAAGSASRLVIHGTDTVLTPYQRQSIGTAIYYTVVTSGGQLVKMQSAPATIGKIHQFHCDGTCESSAVDKAGNIYLGGAIGGDTLKFPDGLIFTDARRYNRGDGFIAKLGYDCRCTGPSKAAYKDSLLNERNVQFRYTGSTEAVDSVVWTYSGQRRKVVTGLTTPFTHLYSSNQAYQRDTICVTVYSGCGVDRFCKYPPPLGVHGVTRNASIQLYPNPAADGRFQLRLESSGIADGTFDLRVRSITGQLVYETTGQLTNDRYAAQHQLPGAVPGIYFLSIESQHFREILRLAVE